jgi:argininosuccinate lyase
MGRGKTERNIAAALASLAATLGKLAMDVCLYMNQNFSFISFPYHLTTGSSIMPHKKNPDVFELIRGKCNKLQALPNEIDLLITNLPSGYHRDLQILKESFLPAFKELNSCVFIANYMLEQIMVKDKILDDPKYTYLYSVELVNQLVLEGMPFRDAYLEVGSRIADNNFTPPEKISHTHEGSIGNLCNEDIQKQMEEILAGFNFEKVKKAIDDLLA